MNILFLNAYPGWGGGETWMLDVAKGLRDRGHRCLIAGNERNAWYRRTKELGWDPLGVNIRGDVAPFNIAKLFWIERTHGIDLVLCNFDKEARLASLARGFGKRPAIVTMKGLSLMRGDNIFCRWSYRALIDHTVVCTRCIEEDFARESWLDMRKFSVINNCFNPGDHPPDIDGKMFRDEWNIASESPVVGTVARLVSRKGIQNLIAAAPEILKQFPEVIFLLVGDGAYKETLVRQTRDLGVERSFVFTGFRTDIHRYFPAFDVFVLPSYYEGMPYVIQEAMYFSVPIVATAVGGIPDAIEDGVNGFLVPPRCPELLAERIGLLLRDGSLRETFSKNASRTLHSTFSYTGMIDRFETLFQTLIRKSLSPGTVTPATG